MQFRFDVFIQNIFRLLFFVKETMFIATVSFTCGMAIALLLAVIDKYKIPVFFRLSKIFISFFRSTPMLCQLFFFYFGISPSIPLLRDASAMVSLLIIMSMNESAFMAETLRGALSSVDKGQREAALSLGMTEWQALKRIVIPQAIRVAIPGLSNSFISLIKGSSLGFTIGVVEILSKSKLLAASNFRFMEAYLAALLVYWALIWLLGYAQKHLETRANKGVVDVHFNH